MRTRRRPRSERDDRAHDDGVVGIADVLHERLVHYEPVVGLDDKTLIDVTACLTAATLRCPAAGRLALERMLQLTAFFRA